MERFGIGDGLLLLALQVLLVGLGLLFGARLAGTRRLTATGLLLCGGLSYLLAFVAHILVLRGLHTAGEAVFENLLLRRSVVALAWALATALALYMLRRRGISRAGIALGAIGGAVAYLVFALWRA